MCCFAVSSFRICPGVLRLDRDTVPQPQKLVFWGHVMYNDDKETLIPYHYCHEHKNMVPDVSSPDVHWHLPSNQITRNRRGAAAEYQT